jgi:NAD-dependent DNA ligase
LDGKHYLCTNVACKHKFIYALATFALQSGIKNLAIKTIQRLYDHKIIMNVLDIFTVEDKRHQMMEIPGIGHKISDTMWPKHK